VEEHLDALLVHQDRRLLEGLRERCLRPLEAAAPSSRDPLRETLRSWLVHMGDQRTVAAELHVHPQTVRYRLGRLRELFGADLDDPEVRRRLFLALAWEDAAPPS
jgi:DNA-binding PucR family transcriptional regulator